MKRNKIKPSLILLKNIFGICKLKPIEQIPSWATQGPLFSITKTEDELSIVCEQNFIAKETADISLNWRCLKIKGPLDFSLTGILSSLLNPLADNKIGIFALSTFDTDYILIKEEKINAAIEVLKQAGFIIN